jgi:hypothetical protein
MSKDQAAAIAFAIGLWVIPAFPMEQLSDSELDDVRGGYLSVGGFTFDFGVAVQIMVDGSLALESKLSLGSNGAVSSMRVGDLPDATPFTIAGASGADGPQLSGKGLALSGNGGLTTLIQELSQTSIRNLVINTAQNRTITQHTDITILMPGLPQLQQNMSLQLVGSGLDQALNAGLLGSLSH